MVAKGAISDVAPDVRRVLHIARVPFCNVRYRPMHKSFDGPILKGCECAQVVSCALHEEIEYATGHKRGVSFVAFMMTFSSIFSWEFYFES